MPALPAVPSGGPDPKDGDPHPKENRRHPTANCPPTDESRSPTVPAALIVMRSSGTSLPVSIIGMRAPAFRCGIPASGCGRPAARRISLTSGDGDSHPGESLPYSGEGVRHRDAEGRDIRGISRESWEALRFGDGLFAQGWNLSRKKRMVKPDRPIEGTQRQPPNGAVGGKKPVEGVTRPCQLDGVTRQRKERNLVDQETRILGEGLCKLRVADFDAAHFGEKLDFEKSNGRDTPRTIAIQPGKGRKPIRSCDDPEEEMSVQDDFHDSGSTIRGTSSPSEPVHSQPQRSALSTSRIRINPS